MSSCDPVAHGVGQRHARVAQVVAAAEAQQARAPGDQPAAQQLRQLVEVEVGEGQPVAELLRGLGAAVADRAVVEAAGRLTARLRSARRRAAR